MAPTAPAVLPPVEGYSEACIKIIPYFPSLDIVYNAFLEGKLSVPNAIDPLYHLNQLSDSRDGPGSAPTG